MNLVVQISLVVVCLFIVWRIYAVLKANPDLLSRENLTKSFSTMGFLALLLIGFVALLVFILKHS